MCLAAHAIPLRTLDAADPDFSDLEPLKRHLAGARIVLLGEQTHGDGSTFLGKARLIAFLHGKMGFDVLCFESGLYDCRKRRRIPAATPRMGEPSSGGEVIAGRPDGVVPLDAESAGSRSRSAPCSGGSPETP